MGFYSHVQICLSPCSNWVQKFFRRRGIRDMLPAHPVKISQVEPWWIINVGYVTEDDIRVCNRQKYCVLQRWFTNVLPWSYYCCSLFLQLCTPEEHKAVDKIIDSGKVKAGTVQRQVVLSKH